MKNKIFAIIIYLTLNTLIMYVAGVVAGTNLHPFFWSETVRHTVVIVWVAFTVIIGSIPTLVGIEKAEEK